MFCWPSVRRYRQSPTVHDPPAHQNRNVHIGHQCVLFLGISCLFSLSLYIGEKSHVEARERIGKEFQMVLTPSKS